MCGVSDDRCTGFSFVRWLRAHCQRLRAHSHVWRLHGWLFGGLVCAMFVVVLGGAKPVLFSTCKTMFVPR